MIIPYATNTPPYRPISIKLSNFSFDGITQNFVLGIFSLIGAGSEVMSISGFKFNNILSNFPLIESRDFKNQEVRDIEVENIYNYPAGIIKIHAYRNISISDITVRNFTDQKNSVLPPIFVTPTEYSVVTIEDLSLQNVELISLPFMNVIDFAPLVISIRNVIAKDMLTATDESLFSILFVNAISVSNITLDNVRPNDQISTFDNIIGMANLNLEINDVNFEEFDIRNSSLSLFELGTLVNDVKLNKTITFKNIRYYDCNIYSSKALISTNGFVGNFNIFAVFSNLQFENVAFRAAGSLIELRHQLLTSFEFSNVTVKGVISGSINAEGAPITSSLYTKFKFSDSIFNNITSEMLSFISTSKNSIFDIINCSFVGLASLSVTSGIVVASDRSNVIINDSLFQNNSAIVTAVLKVETQATIY